MYVPRICLPKFIFNISECSSYPKLFIASSIIGASWRDTSFKSRCYLRH